MSSLEYVSDDGIGVIRLVREASFNAIDEQLIADMAEVVDVVSSDGTRVLIITGTGRAFCAGADLKMVSRLMAQGPASVTEHFLSPLQKALSALRALPLPVIAAVNGACYAGGLEMVLCCDLVLASDNARFSDAHSRHGLLPAIGGVHGLVQTVGPFKAKEMLFTGDEYSALEMQTAGIVNDVVPHSELMDRARHLAGRLCERSPAGLASMKRMVDDEAAMTWSAAARYELAVTSARLSGHDPYEGVLAFSEKRRPVFKDCP